MWTDNVVAIKRSTLIDVMFLIFTLSRARRRELHSAHSAVDASEQHKLFDPIVFPTRHSACLASGGIACADTNARELPTGINVRSTRRGGMYPGASKSRWKLPKNGQFSTINSESLALTAAFSALLSAVFGGSIQHNEVG